MGMVLISPEGGDFVRKLVRQFSLLSKASRNLFPKRTGGRAMKCGINISLVTPEVMRDLTNISLRWSIIMEKLRESKISVGKPSW